MMMNKSIFASVLLMSSGLVCAEVPDIKAGLWEISTEASVVGMALKMPSLTVQECFTQQSMTPENLMKQSHCSLQNMDVQANSASWSMRCEQQGMTMQGSGNIQYQKTHFSGTFNLRMSGSSAGSMDMQTRLSGRYIGQCP